MKAALPVLAAVTWLALAPQSDDLGRDNVSGELGVRLDAALTRFQAYGFSGAVLVARDGQVALVKGYGLADVERRVSNSAATRFEMNSMTKMFTGVAILQLAGQGRLLLNDSAAGKFPNIPFPLDKQRATIAQLASHTSGLVVEGTTLAGDSRDAFVRDVARTPRESPPGERYRYSNAGASLLAAIVEVVSGERYEQFLQRHLFDAAGMRTATFRDRVPAGDARFAHGYVGTPAKLEPGPPNPYVWGTIGAGGVWSTVGDMYRWVDALMAHRLLPDAQMQTLLASPVPPSEEAFGWHVETTADGRPRFQKGGGSDDFASHMLYFPRDRVAIVWACNNLRQRWRQTLNVALPAIVFGEPPVELPPVVSLPGPALVAHAGRFTSGPDLIDLHAGDGYLYAAANNLGIPTSVLFFPQDAAHFTGFDPATRAVTHLVFDDTTTLAFIAADGKRITARRVMGQ